MAKAARVIGKSSRSSPHENGGGRRELLEALLREWQRALQEPPAAHTAVPDPIDAAQEREEEMVRLAVLDHGRGIQTQVEEALHRLAAGRYGLCADCGEPIQLARLRALPFAVRCLACQERLERRGGNGAAAMVGGPVCRVLELAGRQEQQIGAEAHASDTPAAKRPQGWVGEMPGSSGSVWRGRAGSRHSARPPRLGATA